MHSKHVEISFCSWNETQYNRITRSKKLSEDEIKKNTRAVLDIEISLFALHHKRCIEYYL